MTKAVSLPHTNCTLLIFIVYCFLHLVYKKSTYLTVLYSYIYIGNKAICALCKGKQTATTVLQAKYYSKNPSNFLFSDVFLELFHHHPPLVLVPISFTLKYFNNLAKHQVTTVSIWQFSVYSSHPAFNTTDY